MKDFQIEQVSFSNSSIEDIADYLMENYTLNVELANGEMYVSDLFGESIYGTGNQVDLSTLVVTALGIKREERALSYNVQEIKSEELTRVKDANFMNTLTGKVAGVQINQSSAGIGGATKVVMRGAKSLVGDNNVLYVVDGMPMINPSRAASGRFASQGGGKVYRILTQKILRASLC